MKKRKLYSVRKLNDEVAHIRVCVHLCLWTYCVNDVQHVVGFSRLKRDDGVQWRYQTIAEKRTKYQTWVEVKTDTLPIKIIGDGLFCKVQVKLIGYLGSWHSLMGAGSWLLSGRKLKNSRILSKASMSFSNAWWATPENKKWDTFSTGVSLSYCPIYMLMWPEQFVIFHTLKVLEMWQAGRERAKGKMLVRRAGDYSWTFTWQHPQIDFGSGFNKNCSEKENK